MVIAIEPMVNAGKPDVQVLSDGWTAVTEDGSMSAHFEHTVAVTADRRNDFDGVVVSSPEPDMRKRGGIGIQVCRRKTRLR